MCSIMYADSSMMRVSEVCLPKPKSRRVLRAKRRFSRHISPLFCRMPICEMAFFQRIAFLSLCECWRTVYHRSIPESHKACLPECYFWRRGSARRTPGCASFPEIGLYSSPSSPDRSLNAGKFLVVGVVLTFSSSLPETRTNLLGPSQNVITLPYLSANLWRAM